MGIWTKDVLAPVPELAPELAAGIESVGLAIREHDKILLQLEIDKEAVRERTEEMRGTEAALKAAKFRLAKAWDQLSTDLLSHYGTPKE